MATSNVWQDLVISMLSVYQYSLEKVDKLSNNLEEQGLFYPENLKKFSHEEIFSALEKAGYRRGNLNAIFIERLQSLGEYVNNSGKAHCESILKGKDKNAISTLIKPVKGIGPKVIDNYFELRGLN